MWPRCLLNNKTLGTSPATKSAESEKNTIPVMSRMMENWKSSFLNAENSSYLRDDEANVSGVHAPMPCLGCDS